ncbi:MAG: class I SAM-dependent methyltransferase [Gammaproteobacteria bacterium]
MTPQPDNLSYKETLGKLQFRIRAHKEFANFDVSDWIEEFVGRKQRTAIFDLGCGNGNHLGIYLKHVGRAGRVVGLDREPSLIDEARRNFGAANLELHAASMDDPLPFADESFDLCFSNFAIYNAKNPRLTIAELKRVLQPGGEIVLIGPTRNNARELHEFNTRLTGQPVDEVILVRSDRIRREIVPIVREVFGNPSEEILHSRLTFPNAEEFVLYFQSTLFYERTNGVTREQMLSSVPRDLVVSKEMIAATATK